MKLSKISLYTMLLAGLGLWSCNNDDIDIPDAVDTGTNTPAAAEQMTFKATMGQSLSKSTVSRSTGETKFSSTDRLKVFNLNGDGSKFSLAGISETGTEAEFAGQIVKSDGYYAMLPYQENATIQGNTISLNLPDVQESEYEDLMVSYTTNTDGAFNFRHVGAMIRFNTFKQYKAITLMTTDDSPIAGDIQVTVSSDNSTPVVTGGTSSSIKVEHDMDVTDSVLVTLMPRVFEAGILKIGFTKTDGSTFWHTIDKKLDLRSGVMYSYSNVGQYTVTCYKDDTNTEILFTIYAIDYTNKSTTKLPLLEAPEGKLYAYNTKANGSGVQYNNEILNMSNDIVLYPVLVDGAKIKIYANGNDKPATLDTLVFKGSQILLPPIGLTSSDNQTYVYTSSAVTGKTYNPGDYYAADSNAEITVSTSEIVQVNVYGNGSGQPATYTTSGTPNFNFTLPALEAKSGYIGGYNTEDGTKEIKYHAGQSLYSNDFNDLMVINFYPVYLEYAEITETYNVTEYNGASIAGVQIGNTDMSGNTIRMNTPLPKIEKGKAAIFKFMNYCKPSAQKTKNVSIVLSGADISNAVESKKIQLNSSNYGEAEYKLSSSNFMESMNGAEVTVKISNHGGVADVECSWIGSSDNKENSVSYKNISIWDDLYVNFTVNGSYIIFE